MLATEAMLSAFVSIKPTATVVPDAIKLLLETGQRGLPVIDDSGDLVGVISEADFLHLDGVDALSTDGLELSLDVEERTVPSRDGVLRVGTLMNPSPVIADVDASFDDVVAQMDLYKVAQVLVVDAGSVLGIISRKEVLAALASRWSKECAMSAPEQNDAAA